MRERLRQHCIDGPRIDRNKLLQRALPHHLNLSEHIVDSYRRAMHLTLERHMNVSNMLALRFISVPLDVAL